MSHREDSGQTPSHEKRKDQSFIQNWLEENKQVLQTQPNSRTEKTAFLKEESLLPAHIPESAVCDVDPLISLLERQFSSDDLKREFSSAGSESGSDFSTTSLSSIRTSLDDVRRVALLCATYKSRAIINENEWQFKRSSMMKNMKESREKRKKSSSSQNEESKPKNVEEATKLLVPPYHPEYSPLKLGQNLSLSKIHQVNYKLCLAEASCPTRANRYLSCLKYIDPRVALVLEENGEGKLLCLKEREDLERCLGLGAQRVMKDILG